MKRNTSRARTEVFTVLGLSPRDADHLRIRAELMVALQEAIASRRLKQVDAAAMLGVTQPRVSNLLGGRLDLFSTDALIDLLARMGIAVRFTLEPRRRPGRVA